MRGRIVRAVENAFFPMLAIAVAVTALLAPAAAQAAPPVIGKVHWSKVGTEAVTLGP